MTKRPFSCQASTSETSPNIYQTIPDHRHVHTCSRENLNSRQVTPCYHQGRPCVTESGRYHVIRAQILRRHGASLELCADVIQVEIPYWSMVTLTLDKGRNVLTLRPPRHGRGEPLAVASLCLMTSWDAKNMLDNFLRADTTAWVKSSAESQDDNIPVFSGMNTNFPGIFLRFPNSIRTVRNNVPASIVTNSSTCPCVLGIIAIYST